MWSASCGRFSRVASCAASGVSRIGGFRFIVAFVRLFVGKLDHRKAILARRTCCFRNYLRSWLRKLKLETKLSARAPATIKIERPVPKGNERQPQPFVFAPRPVPAALP